MDVLQCKKQENLEKALSMALKAVDKGAELVVFPEVFSTGFCYENIDHAAETLPSPLLENLACFSEANDCIILGSIILKDGNESGEEKYFREGDACFSGNENEMPVNKNSTEYKNFN